MIGHNPATIWLSKSAMPPVQWWRKRAFNGPCSDRSKAAFNRRGDEVRIIDQSWLERIR
jgi:hypothetical protein